MFILYQKNTDFVKKVVNMNCVNFKRRTKKYEVYFFCSKQKKNITFDDCRRCPYKEFKEAYQIKNKSKKLAALERERDKKVVKIGRCDCCKKFSKHLDPHEIYGGSNRKRSILNGFVKMLCRECHSNEEIINQLRIDTQKEYMKTHTEEEFITLIGKSYM